MECTQVTELLSAHHDGFPVDVAALAEAEQHCQTCAGCAAFAASLARLDALPAPSASPELTGRLLAIAAEEAADLRSAAPARRRLAWPRVIAYASSAAVLLAVLVVGGVLTGVVGNKTAEETLLTGSAERSQDSLMELGKGEASDAAGAPTATAGAPEAITVDGVVWTRVDAPQPDAGTLQSAGMITTDLGTGSVLDLPAYWALGDRSVLFVRGSDDAYTPFVRVTRTLDGRLYALTSSEPIERFGELPMMPERFGESATENGSPMFTRAGTDDAGAAIYTPSDRSPLAGFALAPGADSGWSVWSWWEPAPTVPPAR